MSTLSQFSVALLLVLAGIATYISIMNLLRWREIDREITKAKAFLDKSFMTENFKLTLAVVGLVFIHFIVMEFEELYEFQSQGILQIIYYGSFIGSMLALVFLVYNWHKLLRKKK